MKILLLSANTGEGHNSSAKALLHAMQERGIDAELVDVLSVAGKRASSQVSKTYVKSTEGFNWFSKIYAVALWVSEYMNQLRRSPIYLSNKRYWRKLSRLIEQGHYDAVVSCHLFAAESLTAVKREGRLRVPSFFVMTDYTYHAFLNDTELDYYVLPHEDLIPLWVRHGMPYDRLFPIGIPVDVDKFTTRVEKQQARRQIAQVFGWQMPEVCYTEQSHWYLIMSGSMGFGNMGCLLQEFVGRIGEHDRVICVCGRNEKSLHTLLKQYGDDERIKPIGFTDRISLLMDASDVVLSKPGGITTTETIIKNVPLVHTAPIPGIESDNAQFCHDRQMSYHSDKPSEQVQAAIRLASDAAYREQMLSSQRANSEPQTCKYIIDLVVHQVEEENTKK